MVNNILSLAAELVLAFSLGVMFLAFRYREEKTPKTFFTISRVFLLISCALTVIFYNYGGFGGEYVNNPYTTLFKVWIYLAALAWFFLLAKWYLNKDKSSFVYVGTGTAGIIVIMVMISTENLLVLFSAVSVSFWLNYLLVFFSGDELPVREAAKKYLFCSLFYILLFAAALGVVGQKAESFVFEDVYGWLQAQPVPSWEGALVCVGILLPLLFMIGIAPFHFWFGDILSVCILPVCGFLSIVPVFAGFAVFVKIMLLVLFPLLHELKPALLVFAVISLFVGAVNANRETNIRRLFASSSLFHFGVILLTLLKFNDNSVLSGFVYMLVYVFSMSGIYAVFLGFKSNGEYLSKLNDIEGVARIKPYISAAFLIFMFSLAGMPPMLGFLGKLSVVNNLVIDARYWSVGLALLGSLLLYNAYLRVIKTVYFDENKHNFDRVDKGIYIYLFINLVLIVISLLNPRLLMNDFDKMLITIF